MEIVDRIKHLIVTYPIIITIAKYLVMVVFIWIVINRLRWLLRKRIPDSTVKYRAQKGLEIIGYFLIILITIIYFTGNLKDLGLSLGLLSAGLAITFQELILSISGSFYIFLVRVYKPGDRIEINGIKGDVIDIDTIYTTMMEIGQWVTSDNYSGRIVKLSNSFVFKGPVYNYSQDFPFVWDEFDLPIRYGSDIELAKEIIISVAQENLAKFVRNSIANWKEVVDEYYIEDANVHPTIAISLTDNWIQFNLRYIVDFKKRRIIKHILNDEIRKRIDQTNGKVILASATFEIVKVPTLEIEEFKTKK